MSLKCLFTNVFVIWGHYDSLYMMWTLGKNVITFQSVRKFTNSWHWNPLNYAVTMRSIVCCTNQSRKRSSTALIWHTCIIFKNHISISIRKQAQIRKKNTCFDNSSNVQEAAIGDKQTKPVAGEKMTSF